MHESVGEYEQPINNYTILHIKTSGALPSRGANIIEFSAMKIRKGLVCETMTSLLKLAHSMTQKATKETGISKQMLIQAPSIATMAKDMLDFIGNDCLVVAHAKYEIERFLRPELSACGYEFTNDIIDLYTLSQQYTPDKDAKHDVVTLAVRFKLTYVKPSRAYDGAQLIWQLFQKFLNDVPECKLNLIQSKQSKDMNIDQASTTIEKRQKLLTINQLSYEILVLLAYDPVKDIRQQAQNVLQQRFAKIQWETESYDSICETVLQSKAYRIRAMLALMPQLSQDIIESLTRDSTITVKKTIAMHPDIPLHCLEELRNDRNEGVRKLANAQISAITLVTKSSEPLFEQERELKDSLKAIVDETESNCAPSLGLEFNFDENQDLQEGYTESLDLLSQAFLSEETFFTLVSNGTTSIRQAVLKHPAVPVSVILYLLDDKQYEVTYSAKQKIRDLATNPKTDAHTLAILATCNDVITQQAVASHESTPSHILTELSNRSFENFSELKIGKALALNQQTPMKVLLKLARIKSLRADVYETLTKKI